MNLFQKYGIKEVADVTFYSINSVGDEEIYTPVLFLDTLKVSTIEKAAEKVQAEGGKGNKKLITWNFGKEITLNLEDALFSPASMSMIWGGQLESKLSPYTSAIVKINMANKYGKLNYSTKAYPSPALTDEEWNIVFKSYTNTDYIVSSEENDTFLKNFVNENEEVLLLKVRDDNRNILGHLVVKKINYEWLGPNKEVELWQHSLSSETPSIPINYVNNASLDSIYTGYYIDKQGTVSKVEFLYRAVTGVKQKTISLKNFADFYNDIITDYEQGAFGTDDHTARVAKNAALNKLRKEWNNVPNQAIDIMRPVQGTNELGRNITLRMGGCQIVTPCSIQTPYCKDICEITDDTGRISYAFRADIEEEKKQEADPDKIEDYLFSVNNGVRLVEWGSPRGSQNGWFDELMLSFPLKNVDDNTFIENVIYQTIDDKEIVSDKNEINKILDNTITGISFSQNILSGEETPYYAELKNNIRKQYFFRTRDESDHMAMPQYVIDNIIAMIDNVKKIGTIETQIYDTEIIDRMEKCIVTNRKGLAISTKEQRENLLKYYSGVNTESYTIYYDAKTMLPLLSITEDGIIKGWDADLQPPHDRDFNGVRDHDKFTLKLGTVYYKWTRTVKLKDGTNDGILGRTFVIDADTFPDAYKIVGETYIRDQKTGKDQRYQFTIHRATVSTDTSITLEAEGDPTTFSMSVDVLTPPNDIMMELKQYDVDEDTLHGGTRIIPQKSNYTYTPTTIAQKESVGFDNPEMY